MANKKHIKILKQGVDAWNQWRRENPNIRPDLSFVDFQETNFKNATFFDAELRKNYEYFYWAPIVIIFSFIISYYIDTDYPKNFDFTFFVIILNLVWLFFLKTYFFFKEDLKGLNLENINFYNVDLSDVNLIGANLEGVDFREANLDKTVKIDKKWYIVWGISKRRLENYDLSGLDLSNAYLCDSDLTGINFSRCDLSNTNLARVQAISTNFEGAKLTGACIENWNIGNRTNLKNVICDYIYLKQKQKERRPHSEDKQFAPGEFTKLFEKTLETVDLIFREGVDWKAFAYSFQNTQVLNEDTPLTIQSIENKGEGVVLIRVSVPANADKKAIEENFWQGYEFAHQVLEGQYRARLEDKDQEINRLFYLLNQEQEKSGELQKAMAEQSKYNFINTNFGGGFAGDGGAQIGGTLNNYVASNSAAETEATNSLKTRKILILAANPKTTTSLRLDEEVREIDAGLRRSKQREQFDLRQHWAVRVRDLRRALLDEKPQIVHFSGHGAGNSGLALENETGKVQLVDAEALAELFKLFATEIECVVLNACYSEVQAETIVKHIPYVIGMEQAVGDQAAIEFAVGFYDALGAGESIEFAYKLGCKAIQLAGIPEHLTPKLKKKPESLPL